MANGADDLKAYGLRFDLTVPFTRYVLDHQAELTFPFKRYQIQPVWRGERQQRGRYKQFHQADIDVIWRQDDDQTKHLYYDAELIYVLRRALEQVRSVYFTDSTVKTHINNRNLLAGLFAVLTGDNADKTQALGKLFDSFYKMSSDEFYTKLTDLIGDHAAATAKEFIETPLSELREDFVDHELFTQ